MTRPSDPRVPTQMDRTRVNARHLASLETTDACVQVTISLVCSHNQSYSLSTHPDISACRILNDRMPNCRLLCRPTGKIFAKRCTSLLLYETYANEHFRLQDLTKISTGVRNSTPIIVLSTPRYNLDSILCFFIYAVFALSPRPPRARHAHRAHRSATCQQKAVRAVVEW